MPDIPDFISRADLAFETIVNNDQGKHSSISTLKYYVLLSAVAIVGLIYFL